LKTGVKNMDERSAYSNQHAAVHRVKAVNCPLTNPVSCSL
jgi:hypothetical protein